MLLRLLRCKRNERGSSPSMSAPKTLALRDMSLVDVEADRSRGRSTATSMKSDVTGPLDAAFRKRNTCP